MVKKALRYFLLATCCFLTWLWAWSMFYEEHLGYGRTNRFHVQWGSVVVNLGEFLFHPQYRQAPGFHWARYRTHGRFYIPPTIKFNLLGLIYSDGGGGYDHGTYFATDRYLVIPIWMIDLPLLVLTWMTWRPVLLRWRNARKSVGFPVIVNSDETPKN